MIFSFSRTANLVAGILFFFILSSFLLPINNANAGYGPEINSTQDGGGSWGAILELSVKVKGRYVYFMIRKKDGLPFNTESEIALRANNWRGKTITSGIVRLGSRTTELRVRLDELATQETFYACLSNSYGHAWVGPVRILAKRYYNYPEPVEYDEPEELYYSSKRPVQDFSEGGSELGRPLISQYPREALVNSQLDLAVTAGICRQGGLVKVQCVASGSEWNFSNPYDSGWVRPGEQVSVPFRFHDIGLQTISCRTLDSCCASARTGRSVLIKDLPPPPIKKSAGRTETKINISVMTDADGTTKSKVKVKSSRTESCAPFCDDGDITFDKPYLPEYRPAPEPIYPGSSEQYYDDYPQP